MNLQKKKYYAGGLAEKIKNHVNLSANPGLQAKFSGELTGAGFSISCITDRIVFINDARSCRISQTISTLLALNRKIHWIIWNDDANAAFEQIPLHLLEYVQGIYVMGKSFLKADYFFGHHVPVYEVFHLAEALEKSFLNAREGEIILFSPAGCKHKPADELWNSFEKYVENYKEL